MIVAYAWPPVTVTLLQLILTFPVPPDHEKLSGVYTPSFKPVALLTLAVDLFRSDSYFDSLSGFPLFVVLFPVFPLLLPVLPELFPLEVFPGVVIISARCQRSIASVIAIRSISMIAVRNLSHAF